MTDNKKNMEFLIEAEDIIENIGSNLSQLQELNTSSQKINPEIINALFRGTHTLKGISSVSGFKKIATLSHNLEDLLDKLRLEQVQITKDIVSTLSEGTDAIITLLKNISDEGIEHFEIESILDKISRYAKDQMSYGDETVPDVTFLDPDLLKGLSEYELHRLHVNLGNGASLHRLTARISIATIDEEIAGIQQNISRYGEVITFMPASGFSNGTWITFIIIFASNKDSTTEEHIDHIINKESIESFETLTQPKEVSGSKPAASSVQSITRTVKVDIKKMDSLLNTVGELFLLNDMTSLIVKGLRMQYGQNRHVLEIHKVSRALHKKMSVLRDDLIEVRMVPVGNMFGRLARTVDKLSVELSRKIKMETCGGDTKLDKSIVEELADPMMHIIRNAAGHGIEDEKTRLAAGKPAAGTVRLKAFQRNSNVVIEIDDDGAGIDFQKIYDVALHRGLIDKEAAMDEKALAGLLFQPGFSTSGKVNEVSGRGVGLDVVAKNITKLSGMIDVESKSGKGTKFCITLPLTLLIVRALIVVEAGRTFVIPFNSISENFILRADDIKRMGGIEVINVRGHFIPLIRMKDIMRFNSENPGPSDNNGNNKKYVVVVGLAEKRAGIVVDEIIRQREILIKSPGEFLGSVPGVAGFTEIEANKVLPVLDVGGVLEMCK